MPAPAPINLYASGDRHLLAPPLLADERPGSPSLVPRDTGVFVFNPFAEGYLAQGTAFTPVKHQAMLAGDLANLPQFLCRPDDVVLLAKRPSVDFLESLQQAGFPPPEFVEFREGRLDLAHQLAQRKLGGLRPWAWGPDSLKLLAPLFAQVAEGPRSADRYFNDGIARLYSKAWSAGFLRQVLAHGGTGDAAWLCSEQEVGTPVDTLTDALAAIAAIRGRGHHRVVVKTAYGLAGHNAIRLWEPELLPAQRQWLIHTLSHGQLLVVEPWLERVLDFSIQLEMGPRGLDLCGYTGLVNDRKGQFLANWAADDYTRSLPAAVAGLFSSRPDISTHLHRLYSEIFSLLAEELQRVGFVGPISLDAFVYRTPQGDCRLKPVVEINPRYTMGRLTVELMRHASPGTCGLFRLVNHAQARAEGCADFSAYARFLTTRLPLRIEAEPGAESVSSSARGTDVPSASSLDVPPDVSLPRAREIPLSIRHGAICLNDPAQAQVCLATFEVGPTLTLPASLRGNALQRFL